MKNLQLKNFNKGVLDNFMHDRFPVRQIVQNIWIDIAWETITQVSKHNQAWIEHATSSAEIGKFDKIHVIV